MEGQGETEEKVVIIGEDYCPFCQKAKTYFTSNNIPFKWIDAELNPDARTELKTKYNWQTIPGIFINGIFTGGYSDTMEKIKQGSIKLPEAQTKL